MAQWQKSLFIFLLFFTFSNSWAFQPPTGFPFPIEHYDQDITHWINAETLPQKPLMDSQVQDQQLKNFYDYYIGSMSPWDVNRMTSMVMGDLQPVLSSVFDEYDNSKQTAEDKKGRSACNAAPYSDAWITNIKQLANISQFAPKNYDATKRGITIDNLNVRALPTEDRYFFNCSLPGEGDSFDYLQTSALWAGTPVYILGETVDHQWYLINSPDFIGWVKSAGVAQVDDKFVNDWKQAATHKLVAIHSPINHKPLGVVDEETHTKRFAGYIGAFFPLAKEENNGFHIFIPVMGANHQAVMQQAFLKKEDAVLMPLSSTTSNIISVINQLKGMVYAWGGFNNVDPAVFSYDCSSALKSIYTPFGIWLPRHSSDQVNPEKMIGRVSDFSSENVDERIANLVKKDAAGSDHRFMTVVYIGGHVFMYVGDYVDPAHPSTTPVALTFQSIWGLRPLPGTGSDGAPLPEGRYVIGQSVFFPLLAPYPEQYPYPVPRDLGSLAAKQIFQVAYLDQSPPTSLFKGWSLWKRQPEAMSQKELYSLMLIDVHR
ncbi:MAG: peptidase family [Gammaproteobacteria bacterium]|nr:peptidase family [Gammaproteobacteria bacterium]